MTTQEITNAVPGFKVTTEKNVRGWLAVHQDFPLYALDIFANGSAAELLVKSGNGYDLPRKNKFDGTLAQCSAELIRRGEYWKREGR
jgi:hypothetical protein